VRARDNPLTVQRIATIRYRLAGITWEELLERLAALDYRAALVGPHGHGKTTLLEDLAPHLEARGLRVRRATLHAGDRRLSAAQEKAVFEDVSPRDILLLDGAEQLGRLAWLGLRRRSRAAGGLVVTSHRAGLLPTLHECRTTTDLLAAILSDLLGQVGPLLPPEDLFRRHGGNLRDALRELYDLLAEVPASPRAELASARMVAANTRTLRATARAVAVKDRTEVTNARTVAANARTHRTKDRAEGAKDRTEAASARMEVAEDRTDRANARGELA